MFSHIVDDEIVLRLHQESQAEEMTELVRRDLKYLQEWMLWAKDDYSIADAKEFIKKNLRQLAENGGFNTQIIFRGQLAGSIGFNHINWQTRKTEIGYWLASEFQGHGIMTRSCRALVNHAFAELKLNRVEIFCAVENRKSRAIPERLGFTLEGVCRQAEWLHDHFVDLALYAMLADEWPGRGPQAGTGA